MYIWSLSLPFWPLSLPFCSPPAVRQAGREHSKIATPYKSDTYKISVFSTCIRNDRWRTPPAKKAQKSRSQRAAKPRSRTGQGTEISETKGSETPETKGTKRQSPQTCHTKGSQDTKQKRDRSFEPVPIRNMS